MDQPSPWRRLPLCLAGVAGALICLGALGAPVPTPPDAPPAAAAGAQAAAGALGAALGRAQRDFEQGRDQADDAATDRASGEFASLLAVDPANPLLLAYYGSARTLQARAAWAPWNKMKLADGGLDAIDKALALLDPGQEKRSYAGVPVGLVTRLVAVSTFVAVPDLFHRLGDAKEQLRLASKSAAYREASAVLQAGFLYQAALIARREERAEDEAPLLRQVVALGGEGLDARRAAARLQELHR